MSNTTTTAPSDTTLVVRHTYDAPRERVFAAWIEPGTLRKFMAPEGCSMELAALDPRPGGAYAITMHTPNGTMTVRGEYLEIVKPERIVFTWKWDEDDPADERQTQVTLEFWQRGNSTELVLTHERLRDAQSRDNHAHGWTSIAENLGELFA